MQNINGCNFLPWVTQSKSDAELIIFINYPIESSIETRFDVGFNTWCNKYNTHTCIDAERENKYRLETNKKLNFI